MQSSLRAFSDDTRNVCDGSVTERTIAYQARGEGSSPIPSQFLWLQPVKSNGEELARDMLIRDFHAYVPDTTIFYGSWDWLIYSNAELWGMIGYGLASLNMPRLVEDYFNVHRDHDPKRYHEVLVCRRLTLKTNAPKNLASASISHSVRRLVKTWPKIYRLRGLYTLVRPPWRGTCFDAAGWDFLGYTRGGDYKYPNASKTPGKFTDQLRIFARRT